MVPLDDGGWPIYKGCYDESISMQDDFWLEFDSPSQPATQSPDANNFLTLDSSPPTASVSSNECYRNCNQQFLQIIQSQSMQSHQPVARRFRWPPELDRCLISCIIEIENMNWKRLSQRLALSGHEGITPDQVRLHILKKSQTIGKNICNEYNRGGSLACRQRHQNALDWLVCSLYQFSSNIAPASQPFQQVGDALYDQSIGYPDRRFSTLYQSIDRAVEVDAIYAIAYVWKQFEEVYSLQQILWAFRARFSQQRLEDLRVQHTRTLDQDSR